MAFEANYDETRIPPYTLPDPLLAADGRRIRDAADWTPRRAEILELFEAHVYGRAPAPSRVTVDTAELSPPQEILAGAGIRRETRITVSNGGRHVAIDVLICLPAQRRGPVPAFLGLNFRGNHTVANDPGITLPGSWVPDDRDGTSVDHRATQEGRGKSASRWAMDAILSRGYALVTAYCGDIDPDVDDGFANGVHGLFPESSGSDRPGDAWGTLSAWAWGLSRILDGLEKDPDIDAGRVAVMGHSRLGKAALWAGATDARFAVVISNNSGCGGAALSRRNIGETVARINTVFPHWFCRRFRDYNEREDALPVDQHMLLALVAPRPLLVASAEEDLWADPKGEFLSCVHADPVWRLLTGDGLPGTEMPAVNRPLRGRIGYHIRSGKHDVTPFDWTVYLEAADRFLRP